MDIDKADIKISPEEQNYSGLSVKAEQYAREQQDTKPSISKDREVKDQNDKVH